MIEDPLLACAATNPVPQSQGELPMTPPEEGSELKQLHISPKLPSSPESLPEEGEDFAFEPLEPIQVTKDPNMVLHAKVYAIADK